VTLENLRSRIHAIEESYEFFLAYAAQGLSGEGTSKAAGQLGEFLQKCDDALSGLAEAFRRYTEDAGLEPADRYGAVIQVLSRDASDAQAQLQLVMAQPAISSQLIDNLNASIHLRALLTDLFLIDEVLGSHSSPATDG
jgi:hypothetical protein